MKLLDTVLTNLDHEATMTDDVSNVNYYTATDHCVVFETVSSKKQVDVLPSKNQALCDLIYNVIINGYVT